MSFLISYRGDTNNVDSKSQNTIEYVEHALSQGFHVMVDTWLVGNAFLAIGSEGPDNPTDLNFLRSNNIICRARSVKTLNYLLINGVHTFYSNGTETYIMTSGGLIWSYPGSELTSRSIDSLPEGSDIDITSYGYFDRVRGCAGICSSYIQAIRDNIREAEGFDTPLLSENS